MGTVRYHPRLLTAILPLSLFFACAQTDSEDENGKPTLDATDYEEPAGKADALNGRRGPSPSFDSRSTQVWSVSNNWADRDTGVARQSGMAWGANSGLSWEEKFHAWVQSFERDGRTFELTTPYGKSLGAPDLECAETAMFLRIAFASWYELPFFMEAYENGRPVYFGHMGIINSEGNRWNNMPRYRDSFADHSDMADAVRANPDAWPRDERLRGRGILGTSGDDQPAVDAEGAGAYFDEIFLNKRVGYFLTMQLGFNGSMHLTDSANTYNLRADGFEPGDFLVERFGPNGIGHTIVVKSVTEIGTTEIGSQTYKTREAEVVSGTMPRRQGLRDLQLQSRTARARSRPAILC